MISSIYEQFCFFINYNIKLVAIVYCCIIIVHMLMYGYNTIRPFQSNVKDSFAP